MRNTIFEEDRLLTKAAETPRENKPRFDWAEDLGGKSFRNSESTNYGWRG
jgi:hypothetical protein